MSTLNVLFSQSFVSSVLINIDTISFNNTLGPNIAAFDASQFDEQQIHNVLSIIGSTSAGTFPAIEVTTLTGTTFSAAQWSFTDWGANCAITINGSGGFDTLTGSSQADSIYGNYGDDYLNGGGGNDSVSGGEGTNTLLGSDGDDFISSRNDVSTPGGVSFIGLTDHIDGGAGADTAYITRIQSATAYTINISTGGNGLDIVDGTTLTSIEKLWFYGGKAGDHVTGGALDDLIDGQAGNDVIDGGAGNDALYPGSGSDRVNGGGGNDTVYSSYDGLPDVLAGSRGTDTLYLDVSGWTTGNTVDITAGGGNADIGNGTKLSGFEVLYFTGGSGNDTVTAGTLADLLRGGGGNDTMTGGFGRDSIGGGKGRDVMTGGGVVDTFVFAKAAESSTGAQRDLITDFASGIDKIDLSALGLGNFISTAPFSGAAGEIRYHIGASLSLIQIDTNGDSNSDMEIGVTGKIDFKLADFIL